ncbi:MAG: hypothetical protein Kow00124_31910 [Anaerolineae bacterium]
MTHRRPRALLERLAQFIPPIESHTRFLIIMLLLEMVALAFAITAAVRGYHQATLRAGDPTGELRRVLAMQIGTLILLGATTAAVPVLNWLFTQRIIQLTRMVNEQIASGDPVIELEPRLQDEIGQLMAALNRLGQAYHASLKSLERHAEDLTTINLVAATINHTLDLQQVLDISLHEVLKSVEFERGRIYMWDERDQTLNLVSYMGLSEEEVREALLYTLGEGLPGQVAQQREMVVAEGQGCPAIQIGLPLVTVPGQLLGVLMVSSAKKHPLRENTFNLLRTIAHQISLAIDKAQLHKQVNDHAIELERTVAMRTRELAQAIEDLSAALEKAKEADEMKSRLLLMVSHELRTPLTTIKGSTSMLAERHHQLSREEVTELLRDIEEEADSLTELIGNLLDMSRIEAGMLHISPQPFVIGEVLYSAVKSARIRLAGHLIEVEAPRELPLCLCDARRVEQVLANLLDNAARFSPPHKPIMVRASDSQDEVIISVVDCGPGIALDEQERIFDRFYQIARQGDSERGGVGLGLSICRGIVEAHGGRIWVESEPGKGAAFHFSLPVVRAQQPIAEA